jgi:hypothetical protein
MIITAREKFRWRLRVGVLSERKGFDCGMESLHRLQSKVNKAGRGSRMTPESK